MVKGDLHADDWGIRFHSDRLNEQLPINQIQLELDADGRRIYFKDPGRPELKLFTLDRAILRNKFLLQSERLGPQLRQLRKQGEVSRRLGVLLSFFIALFLLAWFGSLAASAMVKSVASTVPDDWEQNFGREQVDKLIAQKALMNDPRRAGQLAALAEPLLKALPESRSGFKFYLADDPSPRAFALPGGHVIVNTGLLQMTTRSEELLGVIAHEIAHVTRRHGFRKVLSDAGPIMVTQMYFQKSEKPLELLGNNPDPAVYQTFSEEYETEADDAGWDYLVAANIDPRGLIEIFSRLKAYDVKERLADPQMLNVYPGLDRRMARLESRWRSLPKKTDFSPLLPLPKAR